MKAFFFATALAVAALSNTVLAGTTPPPVTSSGPIQPMTPDTRVSYYPASRVWYNSNGDILVCPAPAIARYDRECRLDGDKDEKARWVGLETLKRPGYMLSATQVNESRYGLTLVLYWAPRSTPSR